MADNTFKTNPLSGQSPSFKLPDLPLPALEQLPFSGRPTVEEKPTIEQALAKAATKPLPKLKDSDFETGRVEFSENKLNQYKGDYVNSAINWNGDYESIMRQTQSTWDRTKNTATKFGTAAASAFVTGLVVIPNIIGSVANTIGEASGAEGDVSPFGLSPDSDFNKSVYKWKSEIEEGSRNYESNWAKEHWLANLIPFVGDGGFQEIISSSGYTAGAIGEMALTGGISRLLNIGTKIAGLGGKIAKTLNQLDKVDDVLKGITNGTKAGRQLQQGIASVGFGIGRAIEASPKLYRAYVGAHSEAVFEALEGQQKIKQELLDKYRETKGYEAEGEDYKKIVDISQSAGDTRYGLNLAMLIIPNYLQMGSLLKPFKSINKAVDWLEGNNKIGKIVYDEKDKLAKVINPNKVEFTSPFWDNGIAKKFKTPLEATLTGLQKFPKVPLALSEGVEEQGQLVADEYTNHLYTGLYQNKKEKAEFSDFLDAAAHAGKALLTKESALSFLMGSVGGGIQQGGQAIYEAAKGDKQAIDALVLRNQGIANALSDLMGKDNTSDLIQAWAKAVDANSLKGSSSKQMNQAVKAVNLQNQANAAQQRNDQFTFENIKQQKLFDTLSSVLEMDGGTGDAISVFEQHLDNIAQTPSDKVAEFYQLPPDTDKDAFVANTKNKLRKLKQFKSRVDFQYPSIPFTGENQDEVENYEQYKQELVHKLWTIDNLVERKSKLKTELANAYDVYTNVTNLPTFQKAVSLNISNLKGSIKAKEDSVKDNTLPADSKKAIREDIAKDKTNLENYENLQKELNSFSPNEDANYDKYIDLVRAFHKASTFNAEALVPDDVKTSIQRAYDIGRIDQRIEKLKTLYEVLDKKDGYAEYRLSKDNYVKAIKKFEKTLDDLINKAEPALYKVLSTLSYFKAILDEYTPKIEQATGQAQADLKNELHDKLNNKLSNLGMKSLTDLLTDHKDKLIEYFNLLEVGSVDAPQKLEDLKKLVFAKKTIVPTPATPPPASPERISPELLAFEKNIIKGEVYVDVENGNRKVRLIDDKDEKYEFSIEEDTTDVFTLSKLDLLVKLKEGKLILNNSEEEEEEEGEEEPKGKTPEELELEELQKWIDKLTLGVRVQSLVGSKKTFEIVGIEDDNLTCLIIDDNTQVTVPKANLAGMLKNGQGKIIEKEPDAPKWEDSLTDKQKEIVRKYPTGTSMFVFANGVQQAKLVIPEWKEQMVFSNPANGKTIPLAAETVFDMIEKGNLVKEETEVPLTQTELDLLNTLQVNTEIIINNKFKGKITATGDVYTYVLENGNSISLDKKKILDFLNKGTIKVFVPTPAQQPPVETPTNLFQLENLFNQNGRYITFQNGVSVPDSQAYTRENKLIRDEFLRKHSGSIAPFQYQVVPVSYVINKTGRDYDINGKGVLFKSGTFHGFEIKVGNVILQTEDAFGTMLIAVKALPSIPSIPNNGMERMSFLRAYEYAKSLNLEEAFVNDIHKAGFSLTGNKDVAKEVEFLDKQLNRVKTFTEIAEGKTNDKILKHSLSKFGIHDNNSNVSLKKLNANESGYTPFTFVTKDGRTIKTEVYVLVQGFDASLPDQDKETQYIENIKTSKILTQQPLDREDFAELVEAIQSQLINKIKTTPNYLTQLSGGFIKVFNDNNGALYTLNTDFKPLSKEEFIDMVPQIEEALENNTKLPFYVTFKHNGEQYRTLSSVVVEGNKRFIRIVVQQSQAAETPNSTVVTFKTKYSFRNELGERELVDIAADKLQEKWTTALVNALALDRQTEEGDVKWKGISLTEKDVIFTRRLETEPDTYEAVNNNRMLELPVISMNAKVAPIAFEFAKDSFEFETPAVQPQVITPLKPKVVKKKKEVIAVPSTPQSSEVKEELLKKIDKIGYSLRTVNNTSTVIDADKIDEFIAYLETKAISLDGVDYTFPEAIKLASEKKLFDEDGELFTIYNVISTVVQDNKTEVIDKFTKEENTQNKC